ncbi:TPA: hypothetical protein DEP94_00400 [Candidatus Nomurabacteria bacterium]|nr:hypothetical protein [Candidatus Nomurabacteria bacterium]
MKKTILYLILTVVFYISASLPAKAIFCGNCYNVGQGVSDSIKQSYMAVVENIGSVNQVLDTVNNTVLKPLKDAATLVQIARNGQLVNTLITASTGGDPLLVKNPELYLKNKGIAVTQGGVDALAKQNGVFSNSIMNSVVAKAKVDNSSLATKIASINQPTIALMQKAKICNDTSLSAKARSQITLSGGDYNTVKANLNNSLCVGNPATDPALAKRLMNDSNNNPSIDTLYAITSGKNAYTEGQLVQIEINKAASEKVALAKVDSTSGIKSKTTCTKMASNGMCLEETISQASSVLSKQFQDALGADMKVAISSFGSGAGSIIGTAFNAVSLFKGFSSTMQGITGSSGGSSGSGNNGTQGTVSIPTTASLPTTTSVNTTYTSSVGYSQDLKNNPQSKTVVSDAPKDFLKQHQKALDDLKKSNNNYIATINSYNTELEKIKSCYDNLVAKYDEFTSADPRFVAAQSFYNEKKNTNTAEANKITTELKKIDLTSTLVKNTITSIDNSNSTDEISAIFKNYQDKVRDNDLPSLTSGIAEVGKQMEFAGELQISTIEGGEIFNMDATCTKTRQDLEFQRTGGYGGSGM